jgi:flavin reductase (DIM6/NTAB) family NADH-FMN oxidoreductase RutF
MFYEPKDGHGLPRDPFKALVAPRPIGWFTTLNDAGQVNLAPYSYFNAVADNPPVVMFSGGTLDTVPRKDSVRNAEETGEFVHNLVGWDLHKQMNETSAEVEHGVDEAELAGLELAPSRLVKPPRVKAAPAALECRYLQTVEIPQNGKKGPNRVVFGEVVGVYIDDSILRDGRVDLSLVRPVARLGYAEYAVVDTIFRMLRPGLSPDSSN